MITTDLEALDAEDRRDVPAFAIPELPPKRTWFVVPRYGLIASSASFGVAMLVDPFVRHAEPGASPAYWHWIAAAAIAYLIAAFVQTRRVIAGQTAADTATGIAALGCLAVGAFVVVAPHSYATSIWLFELADPRYVGAAFVGVILVARAFGGSLRPRAAWIDVSTITQLAGATMLVAAFGVLLFGDRFWTDEVLYHTDLVLAMSVRKVQIVRHLAEGALFEAVFACGVIAFAILRERRRGRSRFLAVVEHRATFVVGVLLGWIVLFCYTRLSVHPLVRARFGLCGIATLAIVIVLAHLALRRRRRLFSLYSTSRCAPSAAG
ncbi:MAG: hypothetical protein ABI704_00570 [Kofleriaceae bacterium]